MRESVWVLCCCLWLSVPVSHAQELFRITLIETMPVPAVKQHVQSYRDALFDLGLVEGKNIEIRVLKPLGDRQRAEIMMRDNLHQYHPNLVVSSATMATQAAYAALENSGIPQLFMTVTDPVSAGVIPVDYANNHPGISGVINSVDRTIHLQSALQLARQAHPNRIIRIGVIHSDYPSAMADIELLRKAAAKFKRIDIQSYTIEYKPLPRNIFAMLDEVRKGVVQLAGKIDFWWQLAGPLGELAAYTQLLQESRPVLYGTHSDSVRNGALLTINANVRYVGTVLAQYTARIIQGEPVEKLPVITPNVIDIALNLHECRKLGIVVPSDMLELAGTNIF